MKSGHEYASGTFKNVWGLYVCFLKSKSIQAKNAQYDKDKYDKDAPYDNITQSESFKSKIKVTGKTPAASNKKDVEIIAALKYLSNIWRTLEIPLTNCEVNRILRWPPACVISSATGETKFKITDTKLYILVETLSIKDKENLLQQLKSGFRRTINWNKYQSDPKTHAQNRYLNHLVNPRFQGVKMIEHHIQLIIFHIQLIIFQVKVEVKDSNVMIDGKNLFDQPINSKLKIYENIRKIATGKGEDYKTGVFLDYSYFKDDCNRFK